MRTTIGVAALLVVAGASPAISCGGRVVEPKGSQPSSGAGGESQVATVGSRSPEQSGPRGSAGGGAASTGGASTMNDEEVAPCESIEGIDVECLAEVASATRVKVNVLAVIDKSGSMSDESTYGTAQWAALVSALTSAFEGVQDQPELSIGLALFPARDVALTCTVDTCCEVATEVDVPVALAAESVGSINETLRNTSLVA